MLIQVAEWLPDQPPLNNPGALQALNVYPDANSYLPFPGMVQTSSFSAIGVISGAIAARDQANNTFTYAGDTSALYAQSGNTFIDVSTATYNTATVDSWEFVSWAQTVIAVNGHNDAPQTISLGGASFAPLAGAPKARHIAVVKDFIVLGNISDSATQVQRIRWSGINNSVAWSVDATTLADFQDLPGEGGWVQKVISGEQGYIFQERAIWRMTFVGSPLIFQFDKIQDGIGAYAPQSVVSYGNSVYFLAADGFKSFDGSNIGHIGKGKVDRTFFADLDSTYTYRIRGVVEDKRKVVYWAYPGAGNKDGKPNHILIYSYAYSKWARVDIPDSLQGADIIFVASSQGYTLDGLDSVSTSIDDLPYSLDDRAWTGGNLTFAAFSGGTLYYFTATPMGASVQTGEVNLMLMAYGSVGHLAQVENVWPLVEEPDAVTVTVFSRDTQRAEPDVSQDMYPNDTGFCEFHNTARYHRFTIQTSGNFTAIQGVDVEEPKDAGVR